MKAIDLYLAIESNKNIPEKVVYKYKTYRYYPEYKQYYREEYGDMISLFLEATCDDKVYVIEDTSKEEKKIEKITLDDWVEFTTTRDIDNIDYMFNKNSRTFVNKINEIIDYLKSKGE